MSWHASLPWERTRSAIAAARSSFFSEPRPEGAYLVVRTDEDVLERKLGERSFAPNWEQSYHKRGEELNLARVEYHVDPDLPPTEEKPGRCWWQTHVRGWPHEHGMALRAHWELEPTENPREHILGRGIDVDRAVANLEEALSDAGFDPYRIEWSRD